MSEYILEINSVTKTFGGLKAVDSAEFKLKNKEILGLIGPNGAGKTTLFNVISGYYAPSSGKVIFKGKDISGKKPYHLASLGIGRTFQVVKPFPGLTVLQNTTIASFCKYPKMADAEKHAWEILEFTGLAENAKKYASDLTLGGRKKLEISKALALEPELLLLDEVMAGLNPTEADITIELIHKLKGRGISILIVEHIMRVMINLSDRIVVLNFGQQIAEGTPGEIAENPEVITAYLGEDIE